MKLKTLGLKSVDLNQRESIGFILEYGNNSLLLDCGVYTSSLMMDKFSLSIDEINKIFISHTHIDHWAGLLWLINSYSFIEYYDEKNNENNIELIINKQNKKLIDLVKDNFSYLIGYKGNSLSITEISNDEKNTEDMSFFDIPHTVKNTGVRIDHNGKSFCYLPDVGEINESLINSVKNCDFLLISVAAHDNKAKEMNSFGFITTKDACNLCNKANVKNVAFFHTYFEEDLALIESSAEHSLSSTKLINLRNNPVISI